MEIIVQIIMGIICLLGIIAFVGQSISFLLPKLAVKLGLKESEDHVDPVYETYERGIAIVDSFTGWVLPVACVLYFLGYQSWVYFGLIGGGIYIYYFGLITFPHLLLRKKKVKIGSSINVKTAYIFATLWGLSGLFVIIHALYKING